MKFKPMLAEKAPEDLTTVRYPAVVSPKIDGIRCLIIGGRALTRSLSPIPNKHIRETLEHLCRCLAPGVVLDGELVAGFSFQDTQSAVFTKEGLPSKAWRYLVFDCYNENAHTAPFSSRFSSVRYWRRKISRRPKDVSLETKYLYFPIDVVPHKIVESEVELLSLEAQFLREGYEGLMIRAPGGHYKFGRSTLQEGYLLKLKRFEDAEAPIIGFEEQQANNNEPTTDALGHAKRSSHKANCSPKGTLGALILDMGGVKLRCGSGFNDAERRQIWDNRDSYLGMLAKFKYQPAGTKDAPRHPVFLGIRMADDL